MKKAKTLQEELGRMKYLAGIINEAVGQPAPTGQPAPNAPQAAPQQVDPAKTAQNIQTNMKQGMDVLMKDLPNILKTFTTTAGDKDGQLETGEEVAQQNAKQQPRQNTQIQQQVKEGKNNKELMFDEDKYNSHFKDLDESLVAGLIASAPGIMQMGGKLLQKMGSKTNPNIVQKFGKSIAGAGEKLHHVYLGAIEKMITPLMPNANPETKKKAAEAVFMVLVSTLFASHIAHPDALSVVKGTEIAEYVKKIIPGVMSSVGFA
jgi:hypothetical protein